MTVDAGGGGFEGYASTFGNVDLQGERVLPRAFVNLRNWLAESAMTLWNHSPDQPVATAITAWEDDVGLRVGVAFLSTVAAQEKRQILADRRRLGHSFGLSIGYIPLLTRPDPDRPAVRLLEKVYLLEVSLAAIPANSRARVLSGKRWSPGSAARAFGTDRRRLAEIERERARFLGVPV